MSYPAFSPQWIQKFNDPFAVFGLSVAADERRILKRYRQLAKQLHPDIQRQLPAEHQQFFSQVLPKLVNPAYQRLKQDKNRSEVLATLRFKVRRLSREQKFHPQNALSQKLLNVPETEVDLFYEQAVEQICGHQYDSVESFETTTQFLGELNLVYLRRKMGDPVIREKRTGLMSASAATASPIPASGPGTGKTTPPKNYADRHFKRAQEQLKRRNIQAAIQELKDALKLEPQNSNYHSLIGQAYMLNKLPGMAKVHFKQALHFNPSHAVARKYLDQLSQGEAQGAESTQAAEQSVPEKRGLFKTIFSRQ